MTEPDVDAMLEEALDKIDESDRNNGYGHVEPMAALIRGDAPKESTNIAAAATATATGGDVVMMNSTQQRKTSPTSTPTSTTTPTTTATNATANGGAAAARKGDERSGGNAQKMAVPDSEKKKEHRRRSKSKHFVNSRGSSRSRSRSRDKEKKRKHRRSSSRDRRKKSRSRSASRSRDRRRRSRSRRSSRSSRRRSGSRPRVLDHRDRRGFSPPWRRSPPRGPRLPGPERRDVMPFTARRSPPPNAKLDMTSEERDQRTVFILQIARQTRPRDLEEFFSSVGHVRDVRIITDSKTRRSKGICYVEFWEIESVNLALALNGQKLLGAPLVIQPTLAERNRAANNTVGGSLGFGPTNTTGPLKLFVGQLHTSITEDMLRRIFEPFGKIDSLEVATDLSGVSKGYAYVTFRHADDAKRSMEQMNGFELAGRPMKVGTVDGDELPPQQSQRTLDTEEADRRGIDLGASGRLHLMAKLAEGTGLELPKSAKDMLAQANQTQQLVVQPPPPPPQQQHQQQQYQQHQQHQQPNAVDTSSQNLGIPPIATQCFLLSNMFDPTQETGNNWAEEVRDDVIEECAKNGGVVHIYVDRASPSGNVYVKCPSIAAAYKSVNSLHGRWFSGKVITANYIPVASYSQLFPDSMMPREPILSSRPPV